MIRSDITMSGALQSWNYRRGIRKHGEESGIRRGKPHPLREGAGIFAGRLLESARMDRFEREHRPGPPMPAIPVRAHRTRMPAPSENESEEKKPGLLKQRAAPSWVISTIPEASDHISKRFVSSTIGWFLL